MDGDVSLAPATEHEERRAANASARAEREAFSAILGRILRSGDFRFDDHTISWLRAIIWQRVVASGAGSASGYLDLLNGGDELTRLHGAITMRETRFLRTPVHFDLLRDDLLPALWFRRGSATRLKLWSAGCASGEEPYSLAMTAFDAALQASIALAEPVLVLASDIDAAALETAARGIYAERSLANVAPAVRARHFTRAGREWRISETLRRLVQFQRWSLTDDVWAVQSGSVDVLFCHDVLPFFPLATQQTVLDRLSDVLAPGGYLFLAHGEPLDHLQTALEAVHLPSVSFYQKTD